MISFWARNILFDIHSYPKVLQLVCVDQCYSKCSPITWDVVGNVNVSALPQTY